jgi:hypothetical protein
MNDDEERTWLLDNDPANLLPFSKRLVPEDPEAETLGRRFMRDSVIDPADVKV